MKPKIDTKIPICHTAMRLKALIQDCEEKEQYLLKLKDIIALKKFQPSISL